MVKIISKRDGPRPEDVRMRGLLEQNRATITRIADHISAGAYSANRMAKPKEKQARGLIIHTGTSTTRPGDEVMLPAIRISLNGRVSVIDGNTGYQLHHLGDIRTRDGIETFVLATAENGFISPVDGEIASALDEIDGISITGEAGEDDLAAAIRGRLGIG